MTITKTSPLGRESMAFQDKMRKYHAEIERMVYAAEILCPTPNRGSICHNKDHPCPFKTKMFINTELYVCKLRSLRVLIGDHVKQDDVP